jgi:hypothetical protein
VTPDLKFFLPYQQAWIKDRSRLKLMEKSRQIGVSFSTAYRAVATTAAQANTFDTWVSSRDDLQAQLFGKDCEAWARILHLAASTMQADVELALTTLLENGARIDFAAVKSLAAPEKPAVPELQIPKPDLTVYDRLLAGGAT